MKQGTGKTRVAIEIANHTDVDLVLFICPHALVGNIENEIEKWGLNKKFIIETYQGIAMSDVRYLELLNKLKDKKVMAIADESTFIKNENTKTYNRMLNIGMMSEYKLILNGTPITKNEWDVYNQMFWLSPNILKMSKGQFQSTFFKKITYKKRNKKPQSFYKLSEVNIGYLRKLIEPYTLHVDLNFEKAIEYLYIDVYNDSCSETYYRLKRELINNIYAGEDYIIRMLRLIEYTVFTDERRIRTIAQYLKDAGQSIIFCQFRKEIEIISSEIDCYVIHGDIKDDERKHIIEEFKNGNKPLVITLGIGAYGHNFQFCNKIYFTSLSFNYGKIEQAMSRIKRIGQKRDIEYVFFKSRFGIYDMIHDNFSKKILLHDLIINQLEEGKQFECL